MIGMFGAICIGRCECMAEAVLKRIWMTVNNQNSFSHGTLFWTACLGGLLLSL
jgi:hypothetical protein